MTDSQGQRILLIEDNDDVIDVLRIAFEREGWEVHAARQGAQGLQMALEEKPHLILLDIMLPIMDGGDVKKGLDAHAETKDIPIVVLTGSGLTGKLKVPPHTVAGYFEKPFLLAELVEAVKKILGGTVKSP